MKDLFRGYYKLTDAEVKEIWDIGFISFDANVLLNIYRYSEETRNELLRVIKRYKSKLWLSHHAAYEFHKNRVNVISDQIVIYDETIKQIRNLESSIIKNSKTPHLSQSIQVTFQKTIIDTLKDFEKKKEFYKKLLLNDSILPKISALFNKKVGTSFPADQVGKIEKEGEERYKNKVPPGYKDNEKSLNKFGDLIIWKELINKSTVESKPFIYIMDDLKDDWWLRAQGHTISPRHELSQELYNCSGKTFQLYTSDRFLEYASQTEQVRPEAIEEAREIYTTHTDPFLRIDKYFNPPIYPNGYTEWMNLERQRLTSIPPILTYDGYLQAKDTGNYFADFQKMMKDQLDLQNKMTTTQFPTIKKTNDDELSKSE